MRFPYVISENTREAYTPSLTALQLTLEQRRKTFPERLEWGDKHCYSLTRLCIEAISKNFANQPVLKEVYGADQDLLLEILPTNLPLEIVVPLIDEEIYWKRRYNDEFGMVSQRLYPNWTWKQVFIERNIQKLVEQAEPQYNDENDMEAVLKLCCPYVKRILITQLQMWRPPLHWEKSEYPENFPLHHINFEPILKQLTEIQEFDLVFGMNSVGDKFCWEMFKFTPLDCSRLGAALLNLQNLQILRVHRSNLEYKQCQALIQGLMKNRTLAELDLSYCEIQNEGALCVAKLMIVHPVLEVVKLMYNKIKQKGAEGIGYALLHENCCPLRVLDLRSNPLRHGGIMGILRALVRVDKPRELSLGGCIAEDETPVRIAQMINLNASLEILDISANWFGEEGGELLVYYLTNNKTIQWLDVRETDITIEQSKVINKILRRNRAGVDCLSEDEEVEEEVVATEEIATEEVTEEEEEGGA
ncbi:dynein regulatory complex subunit 5-like [Photinus pyralis]|uniref:dynein regulatory complex subunit 5-like n=2 Tax=Photinus pyralis TaxID=7054 RepID=UPI00126770F8|nr:dynein regulatory complex subunit 5-like isoform X1 [Photinus pyralis]XP_031358929.1 dynein regulatory complex subunit 5-like [Photinus pyralis]